MLHVHPLRRSSAKCSDIRVCLKAALEANVKAGKNIRGFIRPRMFASVLAVRVHLTVKTRVQKV